MRLAKICRSFSKVTLPWVFASLSCLIFSLSRWAFLMRRLPSRISPGAAGDSVPTGRELEARSAVELLVLQYTTSLNMARQTGPKWREISR